MLDDSKRTQQCPVRADASLKAGNALVEPPCDAGWACMFEHACDCARLSVVGSLWSCNPFSWLVDRLCTCCCCNARTRARTHTNTHTHAHTRAPYAHTCAHATPHTQVLVLVELLHQASSAFDRCRSVRHAQQMAEDMRLRQRRATQFSASTVRTPGTHAASSTRCTVCTEAACMLGVIDCIDS